MTEYMVIKFKEDTILVEQQENRYRWLIGSFHGWANGIYVQEFSNWDITILKSGTDLKLLLSEYFAELL